MRQARLPDPWTLPWRDLDPAGRELVFADVLAVVRSLPPAGQMPSPGADRVLIDAWLDRITAALVERLGAWAVGWRYTVSPDDLQDRGPAAVWRAVDLPVTTPRETLAELAGAVVAWHRLLAEISSNSGGRFAGAAPVRGQDSGDGPPAWRALARRGRVDVVTGPHRRRLPHASELHWADVDPVGQPFDPPVISGQGLPAPDADQRLRHLWFRTVQQDLIDRYGIWAVGFDWSAGEDSGGPVTAWCCLSHSLTTPEQTGATISAALVEWHTWLVDIAGRFARFLPLADGDLDGWAAWLDVGGANAAVAAVRSAAGG
ncbi:hypothetical protein AB0C31_51490, partial [Actinoplanes philippinensis]